MRFLLDTQVFLWLYAEPERLSRRSVALLEDTGNELLLSAASAWEIAIKHAAGKLPLPSSPALFVRRRMEELAISPLPISHQHALRAGSLPLHHRDPFDRLLVAQAQLEGVPLVSSDPLLRSYNVKMVVP